MKIQPQIARFTRVCSYDRAGYGWSERGPMPRTIPRMAKELKALLYASGEKGPYVMAAVSLGGPIVQGGDFSNQNKWLPGAKSNF